LKRQTATALVLFITAGCASTKIDMSEPRRIVGTENAVRIDAQVTADELRPGAHIPIRWEITNQRSTPIAVADLVPVTEYDRDSHTFTVSIGSEVPGNQLLPRLVLIAPGEKRVFSATARVASILPPRSGDMSARVPPADFRMKLNFLSDTQPFARLIDIKENAIADSALADQLFPLWVERNEVVYTNAVPMRWSTARDAPSEQRVPTRRRGGGI
jgi:hypothetical protein